MSDDLNAVFRKRLVVLLRSELEKVPAFTIEDLLSNDDAMEALARAIMSAPLAAEIRPNLTIVPDDEPRPLILPGEDQDPGGARMVRGQDDTIVNCAREGCGHARRRHVRFRGSDWGHCEVEGCGCPSFIGEPGRVITTAMLEEWASEAQVGRDLPGWMKDALAQPQHDYSNSPIERIKALRNQGHSLTEAKRIVHASLSDEERANVERLWDEMDKTNNAAAHERGERRWRESLSCGHSREVVTFIGDFDFEKHHEGLPALCYECNDGPPGVLVERVSVELIPPEEWDLDA